MEKRPLTQFEIDFIKGYLSAVAKLISIYGNSRTAVELLRCNFLTKSEMEKIGIDDSDIEDLEKAIKEIEKL
jgi:CRISPR/Cas system-associated exonuclease Cas4 (RecB family)